MLPAVTSAEQCWYVWHCCYKRFYDTLPTSGPTLGEQAVRVKRHRNVVNIRSAHIMGFCSEDEEYFCFEDFVTGRDLDSLVGEGEGELYHGPRAEVLWP